MITKHVYLYNSLKTLQLLKYWTTAKTQCKIKITELLKH